MPPSSLLPLAGRSLDAETTCLLPLKILAERITACRTCPSMPPERRRVPGHGPADPVILFVGEAPGRLGADRTGIPFSGDRSGSFLRELIGELGLDAERDVTLTNIVKCNPRDDRGNNRAPSAAEISACHRHLDAELRLLRPRVVVPLGALACRALLGRPLREVRGVPIQHQGLLFLALYHPSYAASYSYPRERYREEFLALRTVL
jgi:uracil-DNA glycosylase